MINIDKKEFEKIDRKFKNYASRVIRSSEMDFIEKLEVFLNFVDECDLISIYIKSKNTKKYNVQDLLKLRDGYRVECFDISAKEEEKVSFTYQLLKYYLDDDIVNMRDLYILYNGEKNYNEALKLFNKHVTMALINCINDYLDERRIDMKEDGMIKIEINGDKSQINVARESSTINATQNNGENIDDDFKKLLENFLEHLDNSNIEEDLKEQGVGIISEASEEINNETPKKWKIKTAIDYLKNLIVTVGLSKELIVEGQQLIETFSTSI